MIPLKGGPQLCAPCPSANWPVYEFGEFRKKGSPTPWMQHLTNNCSNPSSFLVGVCSHRLTWPTVFSIELMLMIRIHRSQIRVVGCVSYSGLKIA